MIVDIYSHHLSVDTVKILKQAHGAGFANQFRHPEENADPEVRLGLMEKYGIDVQALSQTAPVLLKLTAKNAAEVCRTSNTDNYALCKSYPKKFVNICVLSLLDMKSAMAELARSINELDCRGITIATNQNGKGLDSPEYFPLYEQLVKLDMPLFLHPTNWESYPLVSMEQGWRMMHVFGWPFDTTQAVWRLIFGGVLDRFPSLKVVTHHCGAMLPFFSRRIESNFKRSLQDKLPRYITEYWKNIYGDTALDGTVAAYPCGYAFFGPDRMMYGTDYPFGNESGEDFIRENLNGVRAMKIPASHMKKILGDNARKMLKIK